MKYRSKEINKIHDNLFEIPISGNMLVPGRIYADEKMLETILYEDESIQQVIMLHIYPEFKNILLACRIFIGVTDFQ